MSIDPTRIRIESHAVPLWEQQSSFQELMAEQVRHAPWLGLAVALHGLALLILLGIDFDDRRDAIQPIIAMTQPDQPVIEDPPPPVEKPVVQPIENEPVLSDPDIVEVVEAPTDDFSDSDQPTAATAFNHKGWNPAIGLAGGAGGPGGRPGRKRTIGPCYSKTPETIDRGLLWLAAHQDADGKWDADAYMKHDDPAKGTVCGGAGNPVHDVGITGLALLAFLGDGTTLRAGPYKNTVKKGVKWLMEQQQDDGLFGSGNSSDFIYDHAIAAYAMAEAYGLSEYRILREPAQRGIDYLESHRNPYMVWRYQPRDGGDDTSVTGWCVMAYQSARHFGLQVNQQGLDNALTWFENVTDPATGRHGYMDRGGFSSRRRGDHCVEFPPEKGEAMTAVGLFCRHFMHQDPRENPVMETAAQLLLQKLPRWDENDGSIDHYYWYYASYALYQAGGAAWNTWAKALKPAVVDTQRRDGNFDGSWDPVGVWGNDGGRIYSTATLVLTLEAYYRYARSVR